MISKEIANRLVQLKEKAKTYSANYNSFLNFEKRDAVDELKKDVNSLNEQLTQLFGNIDTILLGGLNANFEIETWFEGLKDKSDFLETNPRLIYEEEQRELEKQRKIAEEKAKQDLEELEWQKMIEAEKAKKEHEEYKKRLQERRNNEQAKRIQEFRNICYYGPDDIIKVQKLISEGLDISQNGHSISYDLSTLFSRGRSLKFIEFLIELGMKINEIDHQELDRQREIAKERVKQKLEEIERQKKFEEEKAKSEAEKHQKRLEIQRIEKLEEIERKKKIDKENAIKEAEERQKRMQAQRIDEFREVCLNTQSEDIDKLHKIIEEGLDVNSISDFDHLTRIVFWNKSLNFIKILVDSGLHITEKSVDELWSKYNYRYNEAELLDLLINSKNIDPSAIKIVKEIVANQKLAKLEQQQKKEELQALKEQSQRVEDFRRMCQYSYGEDINKLKKLIEEGLDINNINDFDCLQSCISSGKSLPFIQFLVDLGVLVKNKHIEYCYTNSKHIKNSASIISILENAENIEYVAVENILRRKKNSVIGSISMTCIGIFSLFLPKIFNSEIDNFFYIFTGLITILSLFMAIIFIVDLRKKSKITNTIHLHGNQLPHSKQSEYEIPNAQGIIGIGVKKDIKRKKMIVWIVVTLTSITIIALIYIYFDQIINLMKVLLIFIVVSALFVWRYSPTKRR